jgi:hypothetical protein
MKTTPLAVPQCFYELQLWTLIYLLFICKCRLLVLLPVQKQGFKSRESLEFLTRGCLNEEPCSYIHL